jgi:hypothetical protein
MIVVPEPPKQSSDRVARLAAVADGALGQRNRLHRRVEVVSRRRV